MARIPDGEPGERIIRALFWTLVYHLEPEKWDELARHEPIHPDLIHALPSGVDIALDVGAGSGRLTQQLVTRSRRVVAVEPSAGLRAILTRRLPAVSAVAGWAESLPLEDGCSHLTAASGAFGPDPPVLAELRRVTAPGGMIALIRPERARSGSHCFLDRLIGVLVELSAPMKAEDDVIIVDGDGGVPSQGASAVAHLADAVSQRADRHVLARHRARARALCVLALGWKPGRHPVELAGVIVKDLCEAEELEPRRGSRRHVSSRIPAVHDHRVLLVEGLNGLPIDLAQGDAQGAGKMILLVFLSLEHLDEQSSLRDQVLELIAIDHRRHTNRS